MGFSVKEIYDFDESGFMMSIIFPGMVVTTSKDCSKAKMAQLNNRAWVIII